MSRRLRIAAISLSAVLTLLVAFGGAVYHATQRVQPFYAQALALDPQVLDDGSREFESRATTIYSEVRHAGQWQTAFTADQINSWLAKQFPESSATGKDQKIIAPRIAIGDDTLAIGFRARRSMIEAVVSIDAVVKLTNDGCVAIRFKSVHAGALPLPAMQIADDVAKVCTDMKLPIRWTQQDGQAVALVDLRLANQEKGPQVLIDRVALGDGTLFLAGHTENASPADFQAGNP
jgi:hypothetical protein